MTDPLPEQKTPDGKIEPYRDFYMELPGFVPLKNAPKDRTVVPGLVTSKEPELETKGELKERIGEATKYVPLERLTLSSQCGFASTGEGGLLTAVEPMQS